jgi:putative hydrolase of the HAD superfamily
MTFDLVLFDVDDTLCDYAGARVLRLRHAFTSALATRKPDIAEPVDLECLIAESIAIHPHGTDHFPDLLRRYGVDDPAAIVAARQWYQTNRFLGLQLFPDAVHTLARARAHGRAVGLVTNGPADVQRAKLDLLGLRAHVDFALISGEFGVAKPDPAIFHEALRLAGACAADALYIGDSPEFDVTGARAAGIRSVWMNRTGSPWDHAEPPPDYEVPDLTSLHPLLD